jgi:soluble lytic murein transglycosylase
MRTEAVREWNWALRGMDDRQLLAAADLAKRNQIWDRAINTADKTKNEHDYSLRFLAPYGETVRPAAQNQSLDDAWVYGLMRQESRFITSAKSNVGASGLMQLMPATAKWVAKKIGLRDFSQGRVNDTETNVLLGTSYMRLVMENLDNHPVLASAAYNAGPGRARNGAPTARWKAPSTPRPSRSAKRATTSRK